MKNSSKQFLREGNPSKHPADVSHGNILRMKDAAEKAHKDYMRGIAINHLILPVLRRGWTIDWGMGGVFIYNSKGKEVANTHTTSKNIFAALKPLLPSYLKYKIKDHEIPWSIIVFLGTSTAEFIEGLPVGSPLIPALQRNLKESETSTFYEYFFNTDEK